MRFTLFKINSEKRCWAQVFCSLKFQNTQISQNLNFLKNNKQKLWIFENEILLKNFLPLLSTAANPLISLTPLTHTPKNDYVFSDPRLKNKNKTVCLFSKKFVIQFPPQAFGGHCLLSDAFFFVQAFFFRFCKSDSTLRRILWRISRL